MAKSDKWLCKVHEVECSYGHPCYACKQEVRDPKTIESEKQHLQADREKNAQPRLVGKEPTKTLERVSK